MKTGGFFRSLRDRFFMHRDERLREKALVNEIDRILAETKTKVHLVRNYRRHLKIPVQHAADMISRMITQIPGPVDIDSAAWDKEPVLRAIFSDPEDFLAWYNSCESLKKAFKMIPSGGVFGLLVADYQEKSRFGVGMQGDIVRRDVKQQVVDFRDPRILVPESDLTLARKELQHRMLAMLFARELNEIADLKSLKEELENQQSLLEFKLGGREVLESELAPGESGAESDEAEKVLCEIDHEIKDIGQDVDTPESHLRHVVQALNNIRQYLKIENFTLRLNRMGIKVDASSKEPFDEIRLTECAFTGSSRRAVIWAHVKRPTAAF